MELHTLGVGGGYTQEDVTSLARIITGWTFVGPDGRLGDPGGFAFNVNAHEPGYPPMAKDLDASPSFQAALELVFTGRTEPNGYTERVLTTWRRKAKAGGT